MILLNTIDQIVNFNEFQVFKKITTYTAVNIFVKSKSQNNFKYTIIDEKKVSTSTVKNHLERNISYHKIRILEIQQEKLSSNVWQFINIKNNALTEKIWAKKLQLIDICYKIYQGFVLTPTEVFPVQIVSEGKNVVKIKPVKKDESVYSVEKELLIRIIKSSDIKKYYFSSKNYYSIFPYKYISNTEVKIIEPEEMENKFPKTLSYLKSKKNDYLIKREKGRWRNSKYWYEYSRSQNFDCQKMDKIIVPGLATNARFSLADESVFIDQGSYGIVLNDDHKSYKIFLLGLLNSSLLDYCLKSISGTLSGGYYSYQNKYLSRLPIIIPDFSDEFQRKIYDKIIDLVNVAISSYNQLQQAKTEGDKNYLERKCERIDKEIDQLVYKLYGLTEKEIKIVEGEIKK